jgi:L-amino acid N-acyltransferase YncA
MTDPFSYTTVSTAADVAEILQLQAANLPTALTAETMASQGFVTVRHEPSVLQRMNDEAPAVIAKAGGHVVGYALVMPRSHAVDVPILRPLFAVLETLSWRGSALRDNPRWFVMGQICVAEGCRGRGIFDGLYRTMAEQYGDRFDFTVTDVASRNARSLRAHQRVGFETLAVFTDHDTGEEWQVIALDFAACLARSTRSSDSR